MYFEEELRNGILSWRNDPSAEWTPYTLAELSKRVLRDTEAIRVYTKRMNQCIVILEGLMPDPIPLQLTRLRDCYAMNLAFIIGSNMDPLFKQQEVEKLENAIQELEKQIGNAERLHCDVDSFKRQREREEE